MLPGDLQFTGIIGDVALRRWDIHADGSWTLYAFAGGFALLLWVGHFLAMAAAVGLGWPPELWGGAIGMTVLTAVGMATLTATHSTPSAAAAVKR